LNLLEHREEEKLEQEKDLAIKRRQSISTVRTAETEPDPVAASGTTEAADQLAEQEAGVVALQALKNIFTNAPRGQLRVVAAEVLRWVSNKVNPHEHFRSSGTTKLASGSWPCTLFSLICTWAPVQDRYVVLVTAMDILIRSPIAEKDLDNQYVITVIIGFLLSSSINFIGLSVMDVLVGLVQHILLLLQLGGPGTAIQPLPQANGLEKSLTQTSSPVVMEIAKKPSESRIQLLNELQRCIGCLSVHIYYSEQISDMIASLLARLKPSPVITISDTASAIENPVETANAIASSINLTEKSGVDGFFSFETARVSALQCVKEIIAWANWTKKDGSPNNTVRNSIQISQWEGTQWLLRDPSWKVRAAYVDALLTWMKYELKKNDLRIPEAHVSKKAAAQKKENGAREPDLARRAVSNASRREISPKRKRETFLQLVHLAVYDAAHAHAESEPDILTLHLLLSTMVMKLGVNAVQHGLPMIVRLQEDIPSIEIPKAKINIGSLVHGYFWALSVHFCFDGASTGRDIHNEISRRLNHNTWLNSIRVPALTLEQIEERFTTAQPEPTSATVETQTLKPYDKRSAMVDRISEGYSVTLFSPPTSPPGSPSRSFSQPMLGQVARQPSFSAPKPVKNNNLPARAKEAMLADWTREAVIASTTKSETSRSGSTHGSASPTANTHASKHLNVGAVLANGAAFTNGDGIASPRRSQYHADAPVGRPPSGSYGFVPQNFAPGYSMREALGAASGRPLSRRSKRASQSPTPYSTTSSIRSTVRVDELKKVLGGAPLQQHPPSSRGETEALDDGNDTGSESMVSYEGSELSFSPSSQPGIAVTDHAAEHFVDAQEEIDRDGLRGDTITEGTITPRPLTAVSQTVLNKKPSTDNLKRKASISSQQNDDIPPVPPLPASLRSPTATSDVSYLPPERTASKKAQSLRSLQGSVKGDAAAERPRTSHSVRKNRYSTLTNNLKASWSARDLLDDIDAESPGVFGMGGGRVVSSLGGRPPY
jgi:hypothetical protein